MNAVTAFIPLLLACSKPPATVPHTNGFPADLKASAAELYQAYGQAVAKGDRGAIAGFYHANGALRVLNGNARWMSRAGLDSSYRGQWNPPAYFAWTDLQYDSLNPGQVLVTGGFRWQSTGQPDTSAFIYAALVEAVDSGMAIRFEHETARPHP